MWSKRRFHKMQITRGLWTLPKQAGNVLLVIAHSGEYIQELTFHNCLPPDWELSTGAFTAMPNLKKISVFNTSKNTSAPDKTEKIAKPGFSKLKTLVMVESDYRILDFFENAQVETLKILNSTKEGNQPAQHLLNFLAHQKQLKTLALRSFAFNCSDFFRTPIKDGTIQFQLKTLSLTGIKLNKSTNEYNNLLKFMKIHSGTLEELELGREFSESIYEFVFAKMKKLKSLRLMAETLPTNQDFYNRLEENSNVTSLTFTDTGVVFSPLSMFFQRLPNLENLELKDYRQKETLKSIATDLKQLTCLAISNFDLIQDLQFQSLKTLIVQPFYRQVDWDGFTKANPDISELKIQSESYITNQNIEKITKNLTKLQHLTIECKIDGNVKFFDVIRKNCSGLKTLNMNQYSLRVNISQIANIRGLCFRRGLLANSAADVWAQEDHDVRIPRDVHNWLHSWLSDHEMDVSDNRHDYGDYANRSARGDKWFDYSKDY